MGRRGIAWFRRAPWLVAGLVLPLAVAAQELPSSDAPGVSAPADALVPLLTLDEDRLFSDSAYGRAAEAAYQAENAALAAENRRIEAGLEAEERDLTTRRAKMAPAEFAPLAAEFDQRVQEIRRAQDAKSRDIARILDTRRQRFLEAAVPVLARLLDETGAVALLSSQMVILSRSSLDITDTAIARIDEVLPASAIDEVEAGAPEGKDADPSAENPDEGPAPGAPEGGKGEGGAPDGAAPSGPPGPLP